MDDAQFAQAAERATVFGRITPQQKEQLVEALRKQGDYVAMIGDGVNDVLSLKEANLGIAMQSGSQATRGVADIVLLNDSFAALPRRLPRGAADPQRDAGHPQALPDPRRLRDAADRRHRPDRRLPVRAQSRSRC